VVFEEEDEEEDGVEEEEEGEVCVVEVEEISSDVSWVTG
jgi:hypothetical protein